MRVLKCAILLLIAGMSHAQQIMPPEEAVKFEAKLRGWAHAYYPAITTAKKLPDDLLLGFLVDSDGVVQKHTVGFASPPPALVTDELMRLFPGTSLNNVAHGAACFGGRRADEPKYCVMYAEPENR